MEVPRPKCAHPKLPKNSHRKTRALRQQYTQDAGCSTQCHTLPRIFGHVPMTGAYNRFIYFYYNNFHEFYNKLSKSFYNTHVLHGNARAAHRPLAQRLSSSASSTCTSMASPPVIATSSGGIWSISDPGICRATRLGCGVGGWQPHHARIMQAPVGHLSPSP